MNESGKQRKKNNSLVCSVFVSNMTFTDVNIILIWPSTSYVSGVHQKLDYVKDMGAGAISLSPIYSMDATKDDLSVKDHKLIDPDFGTLQDLKDLIKAVHDKGILSFEVINFIYLLKIMHFYTQNEVYGIHWNKITQYIIQNTSQK